MDVPGAESLVRVNGFADLVVLRDDLGSLFIKLLSLWRQALLAMLRVKELGSQFTLHLLDDLAESRLGDIEFFGGGRVVCGNGHLCEIFQLPDIQQRTLLCMSQLYNVYYPVILPAPASKNKRKTAQTLKCIQPYVLRTYGCIHE